MKYNYEDEAKMIFLLEDMKKHYPNFKKEDYEGWSVEQVMGVYKNYCNSHLPINATTWLMANEPDERLIYKDGCKNQVRFIRDTIYRELFFDEEYGEVERYSDEYDEAFDNFVPMVVATHCSKSVILPVMELELKSVGVKILLRDNFYGWNVTVESEKDIECDFMDIVTDNHHEYCYCEGFPIGRQHGKYKDNHKAFTVYVQNNYKLFTFMWILRNYLYKNKKDQE